MGPSDRDPSGIRTQDPRVKRDPRALPTRPRPLLSCSYRRVGMGLPVTLQSNLAVFPSFTNKSCGLVIKIGAKCFSYTPAFTGGSSFLFLSSSLTKKLTNIKIHICLKIKHRSGASSEHQDTIFSVCDSKILKNERHCSAQLFFFSKVENLFKKFEYYAFRSSIFETIKTRF